MPRIDCVALGLGSQRTASTVTRNDFDAASSDIDFLVEFDELGVKNYADCYFGLLEALGVLFAHSVELVVISAVKNPVFLKTIENG